METGVAGLSIEDATGERGRPLYPIDEAVERMRAARAPSMHRAGHAARGARRMFPGGPPRHRRDDRPLKAYSNAGADCLYAPGIRTRDEIAAVVVAVAPKPVNLLVGWSSELTMSDIEALGVRRISVGGALARAAWGAVQAAAQAMQDGSFAGLAGAASGKELNGIFDN